MTEKHKVARDLVANHNPFELALMLVNERMMNSESPPRPVAIPKPSKYHVQINGQWIDVYDVLTAYGVTNPADQHAIKKMLMPGQRGHKDANQDRREAIQSLERAIELETDHGR